MINHEKALAATKDIIVKQSLESELCLRTLVDQICGSLSSLRLPQLTAAIDTVNEISKQLTERKNEAVSEINSTFEELERALHQRKSALITDLENICSTKQKVEHIVPHSPRSSMLG